MNTIIKTLSPQKRAWITRKNRYGKTGIKPCDVLPQKRAWDTRRSRYGNVIVEAPNDVSDVVKVNVASLSQMSIMSGGIEVCGSDGNRIFISYDDVRGMYDFAKRWGYLK